MGAFFMLPPFSLPTTTFFPKQSTMEFMQSPEELEYAFGLICLFFTTMAVIASYVLLLR